MKEVSYQLSKTTLVVSFGGFTKVYYKDNPIFDQLVDLIKKNDEVEIKNLVAKVEMATKKTKHPNFKVENGVAFIDGEDLPVALSKRLVELVEEDLPLDSLINFWRRLRENPSYGSVQRLFECLERNHHPFTEDGHFIAWKGLDNNFKDKYSHTFNNAVGEVVSVKRNEVDDDFTHECSYGLHVGSYDYAKDFAGNDGKFVEVLVDPKDCVSVPSDSNFQKIRVCEYKVLRECVTDHKGTLVVDNDANRVEYNSEDDWDWYEIFAEGYDAFSCNDINPYKAGSDKYEAWDEGWCQSELDQEDEQYFDEDEDN